MLHSCFTEEETEILRDRHGPAGHVSPLQTSLEEAGFQVSSSKFSAAEKGSGPGQGYKPDPGVRKMWG